MINNKESSKKYNNSEKGKKANKRWRLKNKNRVKLSNSLWHLKNSYGLTFEDREKLIKDQNSKCLICGEKKKLIIDHDHKTGKVRGLLCNDCNLGLGRFKDNIEIISNSILYLQGQLLCQF